MNKQFTSNTKIDQFFVDLKSAQCLLFKVEQKSNISYMYYLY